MAAVTADHVTVAPGTAFARCGRGTAAVALAAGRYRSTQPLLLQSVDALSRPSTIGGSPWAPDESEGVGPNSTYVSWATGWKWGVPGGRFVDANMTVQGSVPWASVAANGSGAVSYPLNLTSLAQAAAANGLWMAIRLQESGGDRSMAGRAASVRNTITYTYSDSSSTTHDATCVAFAGGSSDVPNTALAVVPLPCFVEWPKPDPAKTLSTAIASIRIEEHFSGACNLQAFMLAPPLNTQPETGANGLASQAGAFDAGLAAVPGVNWSLRFLDADPESTYIVRAPTVNLFSESYYDPGMYGGVTDLTKLPHAYGGVPLAGKIFVPTGNEGKAQNITKRTRAELQTLYGLGPLGVGAEGIGGLEVKIPAQAPANGGAIDNLGGFGARAKIFNTATQYGEQDRVFTRSIVSMHSALDRAANSRGEFLQSGNPVYETCGGKWGCMPDSSNSFGGSRGSVEFGGGGGVGNLIRMMWIQKLAGVDGPDKNSILIGLHLLDDWRGDNNPVNHRYGKVGDLGHRVNEDERFGQIGGLGASLRLGQRYQLETEIKLNTVNPNGTWIADGEIRAWLDGKLVFEWTGLVLRTLPRATYVYDPSSLRPAKSLGFTGHTINHFHGGQTPNSRDLVTIYELMSSGSSRIGQVVLPAPALQIAGNTWTPNRDGNDAVLETDKQTLPPNTPLLVAGSSLATAMEQPQLGAEGSGALTSVWSGAAYAASTDTMEFKGSGHGASSMRDNPVVSFSMKTLKASLRKPRTTAANQLGWNLSTNTLQAGLENGQSENVPQADNSPGAAHSFDNPEWIPGPIFGNTKGAFFAPGTAYAFLDLDTNQYSVVNWMNRNNTTVSWSSGFTMVVANRLFRICETPQAIQVIDPNGYTVTDWSTAYGQGPSRGANDRMWFGVNDLYPSGRVKFKLHARGEMVVLGPTVKARVRLAQAWAANLANGGDLTPYRDAITLTSSDGSHLLFNDAERMRDSPGSAPNWIAGVSCDLQSPAYAYDDVLDCVWVWPNLAGSQIIKITGLNTNTWTTQLIAGTGSLQASAGPARGTGTGNYGKCRLWRSGSAFGLLRIDSTTVNDVPALAQIVRLDSSAAPTLPTWRPAPGRLATYTTGGPVATNSYISQVAPYYDAFYFAKTVNDYSGATLMPDLGAYGAMVFFGGGHSSTNDNSVTALMLTATSMTFKRLTNPSPIYGTGTDATTKGNNSIGIFSGPPQVNLATMTHADGQPAAPHSYGSGVALPAAAGASKGSLFIPMIMAPCYQPANGMGSFTAFRLPLDSDNGATGSYNWQLVATHPTYPSGTVGGTQLGPYVAAPIWSVYDAARNRTIYESAKQLGIRWFDHSTSSYVEGTGTALDRTPGMTVDTGQVIIVPERGIIVAIMRPAAGNVWIKYADITALQFGWNNVVRTLSAPINVPPGWSAACWCADAQGGQGRVLVGGVTGDDTAVTEIAIPANLNDQWVVERAPFGAGESMTWPADCTYNKWTYNAKAKCITFVGRVNPEGNHDIKVYTPRGT
jgi:hypothetical protein